MDGLIILLAVVLLVAPAVLAGLALTGHRANRRRLEWLEAKLEQIEAEFRVRTRSLEQRLAELAASTTRPAGEPETPAPRAQVEATPPPFVRSETRLSAPAQAPPPVPPPPKPAQPPPLPIPPSVPAPPPRARVDWEQWMGVRGAAVLGGAALALAGLLFFKYSIDHGLLSPTLRVALGLLAGAGALLASELLRRRNYAITANALAGAGVVVLYGSGWAARVLYGLIGPGEALGFLALVTAAAGALAWRHASLVIAVLGLAGGFVTPLVLSGLRVNPLGLFGYVLLLDAGLLLLARARRWPALGVLSLAATALYQADWILGRLGPEHTALALAILAGFAILFGLAGRGGRAGGEEDEAVWAPTRAGAALLPFAFALHLAGRAELSPTLYPLGILMGLLGASSLWLARAPRLAWLPTAAAAAAVAVVLAWWERGAADALRAWEGVGVSAALALVFHTALELDRARREAGPPGPWRPELVAAGGFLAVSALASFASPATPLAPWLVGWTALAVLLVRQSSFPGRELHQVVGAAGVAVGLGGLLLLRGAARVPPDPVSFLGLACALAAAFQAAALLRRRAPARIWAEAAAWVFPVLLLLALFPEAWAPRLEGWLFLGATCALALLAVLAATRGSSGKAFFGAVALAAAAHALWAANHPAPGAIAVPGLVFLGASVLLTTSWPFLAGRTFAAQPWTRYAAALAGPAWFLPLRELYTARFGTAAIGLLPLALGALSLAAAYRARALWEPGDPVRRSSLAWFAGVSLGFVSLAIPLQLEKEWVTIGWALEGAALLVLWRQLDHPGLKYAGWLHLGAAALRLVANPALLSYYPRGGWPVLNWLLYTYLVPAAALVAGALLLKNRELPRRRSWEEGLYRAGRPWGALGCAAAAVLVVFVWINLAVVDAFATGPWLVLSLERLPARDLTLSLSWVVYALVLLALGVSRRASGLRWASLAFLVLTIGKVFLYDLGELQDLYRVASLGGLALSLLLVSLAYQRFVFRQPVPPPIPREDP